MASREIDKGRSFGASTILAPLALAFCVAEYYSWLGAGRGYFQSILNTEGVSAYLVNPCMSIWFLMAGLLSSSFARLVSEFVLAPILLFSTRPVVRWLRIAGALQLLPLVFLTLEVWKAISDTGMETEFSPWMCSFGIPFGIIANAIWLRYVAFNLPKVRTVGVFSEPIAMPGIAVETPPPDASTFPGGRA